MRILGRFEIVDSRPLLYIEDLDALVACDLHLGIEMSLAESGIFVPPHQYSEIKEILREALERTGARTIVLNGDVKHEFSTSTPQEWREVLDLLDFLEEIVERVIIVRGNHDNFLIPITKRKGVSLYDPAYVENGICFTHGHKIPEEIERRDVDTVIIGHEHPAITLRDEVGGIQKFPCFLYGYSKELEKNLVVMPALSRLSAGSSVNTIPRSDLLSPILREIVDPRNLRAIIIEEGVEPIELPELRLWAGGIA